MKISFVLSSEDINYVYNFLTKRNFNFVQWIVVIFLGFLVINYISRYGIKLEPIAFSLLIMFGLYMCLYWFKRLRQTRNSKHLINQQVSIEINENGIKSNSNGQESFKPWQAIDQVISTNSHILVFISKRSTLVIPKRAFSTKKEADLFTSTTLNFISKSKNDKSEL